MVKSIIKNITERLREKIICSTKIDYEQKDGQFIGTVKMDGSIIKSVNEATDELRQLTN